MSEEHRKAGQALPGHLLASLRHQSAPLLPALLSPSRTPSDRSVSPADAHHGGHVDLWPSLLAFGLSLVSGELFARMN